MKYVFFIVVLFSSSIFVNAQSKYHIPDDSLRICLIDSFPVLFDANDSLIIDQARQFKLPIDCSNKRIQSLDGLRFFDSVTIVLLADNLLSSIDELSNLDLDSLVLNRNIFTSIDLYNFPNLNTLRIYNNQLTVINGLEATELTVLDCSHNRLAALSGLGSLSLERLKCSFNDLELLDLSGSNSTLEIIDAHDCQLSEINGLNNPSSLKRVELFLNNFSGTFDISRWTSLEQVLLGDNSLDSVILSNTLTSLNILGCNNNNFQKLPEIELIPALFDIRFIGNNLRFHDLERIVLYDAPGGLRFEILPQNAPLLITRDTTVSTRGSLLLVNDVDSTALHNVYTWRKDGFILQTGSSPFLEVVLDTISEGNIVITCEVSNTLSPLNTIAPYISIQYNVEVVECNRELVQNDIMIDFLSCQEGHNITILDTTWGTAPFQYNLVDVVTGREFISSKPHFEFLTAVMYQLSITDTFGCTNTLVEDIVLETDCANELIFTPNGDGEHDDIYIDSEGEGRFFTLRGVQIREMNLPDYWDGTDQDNRPVEEGYYIVTVGEEVSFLVFVKR